MAHNLPALQQKAISLREYLHQDSIKGTLESALPKWMSADRLLRIVFTTAMKNPKIMECSKESILSSIMQCAQLGLEPILGRAYLIPYNNTKIVGGKRERVLECQFQPGYQGLVDLARRTNTISDIWGANVYGEDTFDLSYGMNPELIHKPWYMDKDKRKNNISGEIIGAYVVWHLKDGTKHPEFMPISEIHKRRAKSQAYNWAETGDPSKGGGKRDSVWHEWPEEQNLKTVIKHSSKLVPSSIEFMQAIELDDMATLGRSQIGMFTDTPNFEGLLPESANTINTETSAKNNKTADEPQEEEAIETNPGFIDLIKKQTGKDFEFVKSENGVAHDLLSAYIEFSADHQVEKMSPYQMMDLIVENPGSFPGFWNGFENGTWKQHCQLKLPEDQPKEKAKEEPAPTKTVSDKTKELPSDAKDKINSDFNSIVKSQVPEDSLERMDEYIQEQMRLGQCTEIDVKTYAVNNDDKFLNGYSSFLKKPKKEEEAKKSDSTAWNPYESEVMGRYTADKSGILKAEAAKWNISITGKLPKIVHQEILDAKIKADEVAAAAKNKETDPENESEDEPFGAEEPSALMREPGDESEHEDLPPSLEEKSKPDNGNIIDYGVRLAELQLSDPDGLTAACDAIGYGKDIVIPLSNEPRKKLYEMYLKLKNQ